MEQQFKKFPTRSRQTGNQGTPRSSIANSDSGADTTGRISSHGSTHELTSREDPKAAPTDSNGIANRPNRLKKRTSSVSQQGDLSPPKRQKRAVKTGPSSAANKRGANRPRLEKRPSSRDSHSSQTPSRSSQSSESVLWMRPSTDFEPVLHDSDLPTPSSSSELPSRGRRLDIRSPTPKRSWRSRSPIFRRGNENDKNGLLDNRPIHPKSLEARCGKKSPSPPKSPQEPKPIPGRLAFRLKENIRPVYESPLPKWKNDDGVWMDELGPLVPKSVFRRRGEEIFEEWPKGALTWDEAVEARSQDDSEDWVTTSTDTDSESTSSAESTGDTSLHEEE